MKINPGDLGLDYSYNPPLIRSIVDGGYKFVCRYITNDPNHSKALQPKERDELLEAGLGIWLVYESEASRPLLGREAGLHDGANAYKNAQRLEYPIEIPLIAAVDIAVTSENLTPVDEYLSAFVEEASPYPEGNYGGSTIVDHRLPALGWKAVARSWSPNPNSPNFHVHQTSSSTSWGGGIVDFNKCVKECEAWGKEQPKEEEVPKQLIQVPGDPAVFVTDGNKIWSAVSGPVIEANQKIGVWSGDIKQVERVSLKGFYWEGQFVDYNTLDPNVAIQYPGRTVPTDFRGFAS